MQIGNHRTSAAVFNFLAIGSALWLSAAHAAGDFAPLATGNTWVYSGSESGGGVYNPIVSQARTMTLRVESSQAGREGDARYTLAYRDSLYHRRRREVTEPDRDLPDTVLTGRFQVDESAGNGILSVHSLGDPIPFWVNAMFRRRILPGEPPVSNGSGDSLYAVSLVFSHGRNLKERSRYAPGVGLLSLNRFYDVWGQTYYTPGYMLDNCSLISFNGRPVVADTDVTLSSPRVAGFSGLKPGRSWRYRCFRQKVPTLISSNPVLRRDSVSRSFNVTRVTNSSGNPRYELAWKDSAFQRTLDGEPRPDQVDTGTIRVTVTPDSNIVETGSMGSDDPREELFIHFNLDTFPEAALGMRDFGSGPVRVMEYRDGIHGFLDDSWVHAEGIGLVRRTKYLAGSSRGRDLTERLDWRLVELDGKPFEAETVALRRVPSAGADRVRATAQGGRWMWRLRNLLGRIQAP